MAVREIVRLGHPALRTQAGSVDRARIGSPEVQQLVDDLLDTLRASPGVGMSAPQLGVGQQIIVFERESPAPDQQPPLQVVINPAVEPHGGEQVHDWEGCLSIPDLLGLVPRYPAVRLLGFDRDGSQVDFEVTGFVARVVQHEFDHLFGITFLDRMRDLRSLSYADEWEAYVTPGERKAVG